MKNHFKDRKILVKKGDFDCESREEAKKMVSMIKKNSIFEKNGHF